MISRDFVLLLSIWIQIPRSKTPSFAALKPLNDPHCVTHRMCSHGIKNQNRHGLSANSIIHKLIALLDSRHGRWLHIDDWHRRVCPSDRQLQPGATWGIKYISAICRNIHWWSLLSTPTPTPTPRTPLDHSVSEQNK